MREVVVGEKVEGASDDILQRANAGAAASAQAVKSGRKSLRDLMMS